MIWTKQLDPLHLCKNRELAPVWPGVPRVQASACGTRLPLRFRGRAQSYWGVLLTDMLLNSYGVRGPESLVSLKEWVERRCLWNADDAESTSMYKISVSIEFLTDSRWSLHVCRLHSICPIQSQSEHRYTASRSRFSRCRLVAFVNFDGMVQRVFPNENSATYRPGRNPPYLTVSHFELLFILPVGSKKPHQGARTKSDRKYPSTLHCLHKRWRKFALDVPRGSDLIEADRMELLKKVFKQIDIS